MTHVWSNEPEKRGPYCIVREISDGTRQLWEVTAIYRSGLKYVERFEDIAAARRRADEWFKVWHE